jgi:hypothetical protein
LVSWALSPSLLPSSESFVVESFNFADEASFPPSRGFDNEELGRELAVDLRTRGVAFGVGLLREIDPLATRVVPDPFEGVVVGGRVELDVVPDTLTGRLAGRLGVVVDMVWSLDTILAKGKQDLSSYWVYLFYFVTSSFP